MNSHETIINSHESDNKHIVYPKQTYSLNMHNLAV